MEKKLVFMVLPLMLLMPGCVQPTPSPAMTVESEKEINVSDHVDSFEIVWQTINDTYFDPTFGGLDWNEVRERYQPLIAAAQEDETFYLLYSPT
jgi:PBP1b-binding outer membrane lipoprotein LpoB